MTSYVLVVSNETTLITEAPFPPLTQDTCQSASFLSRRASRNCSEFIQTNSNIAEQKIKGLAISGVVGEVEEHVTLNIKKINCK